MRRILKALLKTILYIAIMGLVGIIGYFFPFVFLGIIVLTLILAIFISFYEKED